MQEIIAVAVCDGTAITEHKQKCAEIITESVSLKDLLHIYQTHVDLRSRIRHCEESATKQSSLFSGLLRSARNDGAPNFKVEPVYS